MMFAYAKYFCPHGCNLPMWPWKMQPGFNKLACPKCGVVELVWNEQTH